MASLPVHLLMGAALGLAAETTGGPAAAVAGMTAAAISHVWLDDLNVEEMRWYHGYGTGLLRVVYTSLTVLVCMGLMAALIIRPQLIPYAIIATWADWEHPVRWLLKTEKFYLHGRIIAWEGWRRPVPGSIAWMVTMLALLLSVVRFTW